MNAYLIEWSLRLGKGILKNIYLCVELALENYDARTKYKQNFLGDQRSSGEAVTCLLEVPKHIAFLYMKPGCLELWVASHDKSKCTIYQSIKLIYTICYKILKINLNLQTDGSGVPEIVRT